MFKRKSIETTITLSQSIISKFSSQLSYKHHVGEEPLRYITVGKLLEEASTKYEHEAIISRHQNKSLTFQQILHEADQLATGFIELGLQKNDRIGLWMPNVTEWYITAMACARAGFIMVGLNPVYQPPEMEYCINKVEIKAMVCSEMFKSQDYHASLVEIAPDLVGSQPGKLNSAKVPSLKSVIMLGDSEKSGCFHYKEILDLGKKSDVDVKKLQRDLNPDQPFNIQFSSGTTGKPKSVLTSHFNMVNNGYTVGKRNEQNRKHHKICIQVPLFHAFGTVISSMSSLNFGSTMVFPSDSYNPDKSLDAIKEEKCTMVHGTPTMYVDLVHRQEVRNEDIAPEIAVSGGALCSPHLFEKMLKFLHVHKVKSVYGLSETTAVVFQSLENENCEQHLSTVGHLGDHIEAKVMDGDGNLVPFGSPGELCLRSYSNMICYWGDAENTKKTRDDDGWLKTGDQFVLQEDGYGRIVGRLKEMIIRGGENIYPREIEDFLSTHPSILETHVIGIPHERLGEEVCACVRLKPEQHLDLTDIREYCKGKLSHYKIPTVLRIIEEFPKTLSGKVQKYKLVAAMQ